MNLTEFAIKNKLLTVLITVVLFLGGIYSYIKLGKLEDPEFTVKTAVIVTQYPGANPEQVEQQVTDKIEIALQEIPELDYIESLSRQGLSMVKIEVKSEFWSDRLPQIWDSVRKKIADATPELPRGASTPIIHDDTGNVYGFVIALTGDGFSQKEIEERAKEIKRKLSLVEGVGQVELWGKKQRAIYLKIKNSKLNELGVTTEEIQATINRQNQYSYSGKVFYNDKFLQIEVSGGFDGVKDIEELVIVQSDGDESQLIKVKDIAEVREEVVEPSIQSMKFNGNNSVAIAISNIEGSNIIDLGLALKSELQEIQKDLPIGYNVHTVAWQEDEVSKAIDNFIISLIEAVVIVLVVLTVFMGWRMGVIIGTALVLTIVGTLLFMGFLGIDLQRMSLGALVIALGMMVDNAIVVGDGILNKMKQGVNKVEAAVSSARGPSIPLLGSTIIAVLAFYPIGGSSEDVGEYCLSLFQVVGISLLFSWVVSMTITPLQCLWMLKLPKNKNNVEPYQGIIYRLYRSVLDKSIRHKRITGLGLVAALGLSVWGFKYVPQLFFPDSSRPQFMVDVYGETNQREHLTENQLEDISKFIQSQEGVKSVSSFIGSGPPRFYLPVAPELPYTSYGQLIVSVDDYKKIDTLKQEIESYVENHHSNIPTVRVRKYGVGPANAWKYELRLKAPEGAGLEEIRSIASKGLDIVKGHPDVEAARLNWREQAAQVDVNYDQDRGRLSNISRSQVQTALNKSFDGQLIGQYKEKDELLPIFIRNLDDERNDPSLMNDLEIRRSSDGAAVPMSQVTNGHKISWIDPLIWRYDRSRTVTIQAEPKQGVTLPSLRASVMDQVKEFEANLPNGYSIEWGAEAESTEAAQRSLIPGVIPAVVIILLIIVYLFNEIKPAIIIFLTIPLSIIGITTGLLVTNVAFGFMALLGALSLMGMVIKNAIVLMDEIKLNLSNGMEAYDAVVSAGVSRLNPVALAAATTILGVIPLIQDVFWVSMAVTIMGGLAFATLLTMIVVPLLYCHFYQISPPKLIQTTDENENHDNNE